MLPLVGRWVVVPCVAVPDGLERSLLTPGTALCGRVAVLVVFPADVLRASCAEADPLTAPLFNGSEAPRVCVEVVLPCSVLLSPETVFPLFLPSEELVFPETKLASYLSPKVLSLNTRGLLPDVATEPRWP